MADDLERWFQALPDRVQGDLEDAVQGQADRLSDAQRESLQSLLQPPEDGGELEGSLRVEDGRSPTEKLVLAGGETTTVDGYDYALGFALGTQKQPARDFFYAPYRAMQASIRRELEKALSRAISKA